MIKQRIDEYIDERDGWIDEMMEDVLLMNEYMKGWMDKSMDEWINE